MASPPEPVRNFSSSCAPSPTAANTRNARFLFEDLRNRITEGPIGFQILVQVADRDEVVDDATIHWPENRPLIRFGNLVLTAVVPDTEQQQKHIIFDPIPRVDGIEPSEDPLLELRAAVYLLGRRRRRQAPILQAQASNTA